MAVSRSPLIPALLAFAIAAAAPVVQATPEDAGAPAGVAAPALGRVHVIGPAPALFDGSDAEIYASSPAQAPAGTLAELSRVQAREGYAVPQRRDASHPVRASLRGAGAGAGPGAGDGDTTSQPASRGWPGLACVVAIVTFIARRKLSLRA